MSKKISAEWISAIAAVLAVIASLVSIVFSLFPKLNPLNDNYIDKANSGDVKSQVFLANLNYEIGNTSESVYWYSVALTHSGEYQGKAINNLAYIYLLNEEFYITRKENYRDAMKMFMAAADLGEIDAAKNLYILLTSNPRELFGDEYDAALNTARNMLEEEIDISELLGIEWSYVETASGDYVPANNAEYKYVEIGNAQYVMDGERFVWVHTYKVYQKDSESEPMEYIYIKVSE